MKKLILISICTFIIFFANAVDLNYPDRFGGWSVYHIPTNYLGHTYPTISTSDIGFTNCESGDLFIIFTLDSQEQDEGIILESFSHDSNWDYLQAAEKLPFIINYLVFKGHATSCATMSLDINDLGAQNYKYYKDPTTHQCLLATTRSEAMCEKGCKDCRELHKS